MINSPTKLTPKQMEAVIAAKKLIVINAIGKGMDNQQAAALVNIDNNVLYNWFKKDPEFKACVDHEIAVTTEYVMSKLFENIQKGDVASIFFFLKTKAGFNEYAVVKHEGEIKHSMSTQDRAALRNVEVLDTIVASVSGKQIDKTSQSLIVGDS